MIQYRLKIAVIFIFFGIAMLFHLKHGLAAAIYMYIASLVFLVSHFLFGTVHGALNLLKGRNYDQAELLLSKNKHPEWLVKRNRAYFHFAHGIIALQHKDLEKGKTNFQQAADIGLRNAKDNALAFLNLAHIAYVQKNVSVAHAHLKKAKAFKTDDLIVKENLQNLEKALKRLK